MQGILEMLMGAVSVCTAKHIAEFHKRPNDAVVMAQSVYPKPAVKCGRPSKKAATEKAASDKQQELLRV